LVEHVPGVLGAGHRRSGRSGSHTATLAPPRRAPPVTRLSLAADLAHSRARESVPFSTGRLMAMGRIHGPHLPEGPRRRPHRRGGGDNRRGGLDRGEARDHRARDRRPSEAEPFWLTFLKGLVKRGLRDVKLVISDAHDGLRHAIILVLSATWQRRRVHWMRISWRHVPKGRHTMVAAAIRGAFFKDARSRLGARSPWGRGTGEARSVFFDYPLSVFAGSRYANTKAPPGSCPRPTQSQPIEPKLMLASAVVVEIRW